MKSIHDYVKAGAAIPIFFFCYDLLHREDTTHVLPPGGVAVIGNGTVTTNNTSKPNKPNSTYVPPEGTVTVINSSGTTPGTVSVNHGNGSNTSSNVTIIIKDKGFYKVPGIAVVYSDRALADFGRAVY